MSQKAGVAPGDEANTQPDDEAGGGTAPPDEGGGGATVPIVVDGTHVAFPSVASVVDQVSDWPAQPTASESPPLRFCVKVLDAAAATEPPTTRVAAIGRAILQGRLMTERGRGRPTTGR